jgi:ribosome-associated protein
MLKPFFYIKPIMQTIEFPLSGEYIELLQLLKASGLAQTGGHAKIIVTEGEVFRDGEVELRKRAKIRKGDSIVVGGEITIKVI